jgi:hypothetical protein
MFYTYAHVTSDTNKIFYIGKGTGRRMFRKDARNQHWHNTIAKHGYTAIKLADWKTSEEAFSHEKLLISSFKNMGYKLVNQSEGGDGNNAQGGLSFKGKKHTKEAIEKTMAYVRGIPKSKEANLKNAISHRKAIKVNGVAYNSWMEASQKTGIPMGSISYLLKGKSLKKWANYSLELVM